MESGPRRSLAESCDGGRTEKAGRSGIAGPPDAERSTRIESCAQFRYEVAQCGQSERRPARSPFVPVVQRPVAPRLQRRGRVFPLKRAAAGSKCERTADGQPYVSE